MRGAVVAAAGRAFGATGSEIAPGACCGVPIEKATTAANSDEERERPVVRREGFFMTIPEDDAACGGAARLWGEQASPGAGSHTSTQAV
jgi:hypothetical protein